MQERIRHEHQTPRFPNGFSVPPAVLVQAQMRFTVLIKGFYRPALQRQGDDPWRTPVHPVGHQHGSGTGQLRIGETEPQAPWIASCTNARSAICNGVTRENRDGGEPRSIGARPATDRTARSFRIRSGMGPSGSSPGPRSSDIGLSPPRIPR